MNGKRMLSVYLHKPCLICPNTYRLKPKAFPAEQVDWALLI